MKHDKGKCYIIHPDNAVIRGIAWQCSGTPLQTFLRPSAVVVANKWGDPNFKSHGMVQDSKMFLQHMLPPEECSILLRVVRKVFTQTMQQDVARTMGTEKIRAHSKIPKVSTRNTTRQYWRFRCSQKTIGSDSRLNEIEDINPSIYCRIIKDAVPARVLRGSEFEPYERNKKTNSQMR